MFNQIKTGVGNFTVRLAKNSSLIVTFGCILTLLGGNVLAKKNDRTANRLTVVELSSQLERADSEKRIMDELNCLASEVDLKSLGEDIVKADILINTPPPEVPPVKVVEKVIPKVEKKPVVDSKGLIKVSASAYKMGTKTSSGTSVRLGVLAASSDLIRLWGYGCTVIVYSKDSKGEFHKYGEFLLEDKMHQRYKNSCDIYMSTYKEAVNFGRRTMWLEKKSQ